MSTAPPAAPPEPIAARNSSKFRDRLGILLVGGFLLTLLGLFFRAIPEANEQLITYMLGQLSGFAAGVVAYHYTMNSTNARATENTAAAFRAVEAAAVAGTAGTGNDTPAGTEADPLIVAGAPEGHRPVTTRGAKS